MAALDNVTNVRIELVINGVAQEPIIADTTTTTDVLPRITPEDTVTGTAYINLSDGTVRAAQLDATQTSTGKVLKFKVPYNYTCSNDNGTLASGTYYARDGIDLSAYTASNMLGWLCSDGTMHNGSYVTGVRGDITLSAVLDFSYSASGGHATGSPVPAGTETDPFVLVYGSTDSEETCIDLYISDFSGTMSTTSNSDGKLTISGSDTDSPAIMINTSVITSFSAIPAAGYKYKITMTDSGTGSKKEFWVHLRKRVGSKTAPDAVGDIVFADGSASAYTETLTADQIAEAVAVIFDAGNKIGMGLNRGTNLQWCSSSAIASHSTVYATDSNDGKANTNQIAALSDYNASNYPAFWFCTSYSAPGYTSGWYLLTSQEQITLCNNITTVTAAFTALGQTFTFTDSYWTSFTYYTSGDKAKVFKPDGSSEFGATKSWSYNVFAVHVFN